MDHVVENNEDDKWSKDVEEQIHPQNVNPG